MCVKHVPDGQGDRRMEEGRIVRGEDDTLNELDEFAIEAAVSLIEDQGGEVIALTMGPEDSADALLRALQMGADRAVHICDDRLAGSDSPQTANVLAAAIKTLEAEIGEPIDLVVLGMASLDGMTSLVPPAVATRLGRPYLGLVSELDAVETPTPGLQVKREADGWADTLAASFPLVVSVTDQLNEPRYPSFKSLRAARSKPMAEWTWDDLNEAAAELGIPGLAEPAMLVSAEPAERDGTGVIVQDTGEGAELLASYLYDQLK